MTITPSLTGSGELVALDPARAFLGAVLCLDHGPAREVFTGMRPDDFTDPKCAATAGLIIGLLADDQPPQPALVWAAAEHNLNPHQLERFGDWLIDTYRAAPLPATARHLKTIVLGHAWRAAIRDYATRLLQATDQSPDDVLAALYDDRDRITDYATRHTTAATPATPHPRVA
ncbi:hypothetical protein [Sciscionella sediminilitoris]|uniref:hypothetical protein n=1 Tax=Sciscionella sediminilitoris TaxID=1445613 RepID=UPI000691EBDD|nr:hypothetical protein [Sciscionella sp. SE31]